MASGLNWGILRQARMTQAEFGSLLKVSRVTVSAWAGGRAEPHPKRQRAVERLLWAIERAVSDQRLPLPLTEDRMERVKRLLVSYLRTA